MSNRRLMFIPMGGGDTPSGDCNLENLNVTPTEQAQDIRPSGDVDGYKRVRVAAVDASIDPNITAGNIKDGVTILGVTGNYQGGGGGGCNNMATKGITTNGTFDASDEGYDGYEEVVVNVPASAVVSGTKIITSNGTEDVTNYASVNVHVQPTLQNKTVTPSGTQQTVTYDNLYDGLGTVTVNAVSAAVDANITPANIKDGVTILGVTGTYVCGTDTDFLRMTANEYSEVGYQNGTSNTIRLYASTDNVNFNSWDGTAIALNQGDTLYIYGDNASFSANNVNYVSFVINGSVAVSGDVTSLLSRTGTNTLPSYCFNHLFYNQPITSAPDLRATSLGSDCYTSMFQGCTQLTTTPILPATTAVSYCYDHMFCGCTGLTTISTIAATTLRSNCCRNMFEGCTSLTSTPVLPATTLDTACYSRMFMNCTGLTTVTALPATTLGDHCYMEMFSGCTSLVSVPNLTATTLVEGCYSYMFFGCTSLVTAPAVHGTTFDITRNDGCCASMFQNCTSLTTATTLPTATTMSKKAFYHMFDGCTSLVNIPATLPATTLDESCYEFMFKGCSSLVTAPSLPATDITGRFAYNNMFENCTSLVNAPALPATTLTDYAYYEMFKGCTSLVTAPELPATTLVNGCYQRMFSGCSSLNYVKVLAENWAGTNNWLNGVAQTGTLDKPCDTVIPLNDNSGVPTGWTVVDHCLERYVCFTAVDANVRVWYAGKEATFYASTDGGQTFTQMTKQVPVVLSNIGDKVYIYGNNDRLGSLSDQSIYTKINIGDGSATISGDLTRLLNINGLTTLPDRAFIQTFENNSYLTSAADLTVNVTSVGERSLQGLFENCSNLIDGINALPATTLGNYCYANMYNGCEKLTNIPATLPATTLADYCYMGMFRECKRIVTTPALPATTLATDCYMDMFNHCIALRNAPATLPATTLARGCYYAMFYNCDSLETAPVLPATTLVQGCYAFMFKYSQNLNSITCLATDISATNSTIEWVSGVASSGTFTKSPQMTSWTTGVGGIPTGWTVVDF